ncbi:MAG: hypothetical protein ACKVPX_16230 [Myxococcaceae bacterium]
MNASNPSPMPGDNVPQEADLLDYAQLWRQVGFVARALSRHRTLFVCVVLAIISVTSLLLAVWPRTYKVSTTILAQRNQVLASIGNPRRAIPLDADAPTRAVTETVMRRDNLVALVKQTNLLDTWDATRAPLTRARDTFERLLFGKPSDEDRLDGFVKMLEKRLVVTTNEGLVTIDLEWPNGALAYRMAEAAQQNFLEARHVTEVSSIEDAISILEARTENVQQWIQTALEEVLRQQAGSPRPTPTPSKPERPAGVSLGMSESAPDQELAQIRFLLRAKRRAMADLEDFRNKKASELQAQLAEQKVVYSDQHPVILDTVQRLRALEQASPQLMALKQEEQDLLSEFRRRGGKDPEAISEPARSVLRPTESFSRPNAESPHLAYAQHQVRIAQDTQQDLVLRIDAARIELDTARAAFKYRYSIVNPPQMPKRPEKPNVPLVLFASVIAALALGVLAVVLEDMRHGRLHEAWQIEQTLKLPLLGEVTSP